MSAPGDTGDRPRHPVFEEDPPPRSRGGDANDSDQLLLNIEGYEGPIDILLQMARDQKVDLTRISILQLARQYLAFVDRARELRLDLAAEYLVMAAWLAYLKSRLLLPAEDKEDEDPSGQQMAEALQFQLRRLEAMQDAAEKLMSRPQLGVSFFARGMPEGLQVETRTRYRAGLVDILRVYGDISRRKTHSSYEPVTFNLMSMEDAMERMTKMLGHLPRNGPYSVWTTLHSFLPDDTRDALFGRSAIASLLTASLEMVKQGRAEVRQDGPFRPIYLRGREGRDEDNDTDQEDENG